MGGGVGLAYLLEQGVSFDTWRKSGSLVADTFGEGSESFFEGSSLFDARSLFHGGCLLLTGPNRRVQQATILVRVHSAFRALVNTTCSNHRSIAEPDVQSGGALTKTQFTQLAAKAVVLNGPLAKSAGDEPLVPSPTLGQCRSDAPWLLKPQQPTCRAMPFLSPCAALRS
jgi:hypothetical protein